MATISVSINTQLFKFKHQRYLQCVILLLPLATKDLLLMSYVVWHLVFPLLLVEAQMDLHFHTVNHPLSYIRNDYGSPATNGRPCLHRTDSRTKVFLAKKISKINKEIRDSIFKYFIKACFSKLFFVEMVVYGSLIALVKYGMESVGSFIDHFGVSAITLSFLSAFISFSLIFRTNICYNRYVHHVQISQSTSHYLCSLLGSTHIEYFHKGGGKAAAFGVLSSLQQSTLLCYHTNASIFSCFELPTPRRKVLSG